MIEAIPRILLLPVIVIVLKGLPLTRQCIAMPGGQYTIPMCRYIIYVLRRGRQPKNIGAESICNVLLVSHNFYSGLPGLGGQPFPPSVSIDDKRGEIGEWRCIN